MVLSNNKKKSDGSVTKLKQTFDSFVSSLSNVLLDITALEVNTMVVEQITGMKFIAWSAYRDLYVISQGYLEKNGFHPSLYDNYLGLRKQLEIEYCVLVLESDPANHKNELQSYVQGLSNNNNMELTPENSKLPNPLLSINQSIVDQIDLLFQNGRFLRSLRKLDELKAALDNRNAMLMTLGIKSDQLRTDIIYAQSVLQLDGDVINRYDRRLLDHQHKDLILEIHRQGVSAGERQWRSLLDFMVNLTQILLTKVF